MKSGKVEEWKGGKVKKIDKDKFSKSHFVILLTDLW
jgi:hypothetical protein